MTEEKYIPNPNKIPNIKKDSFIGLPTLEKLNPNYIEKITKNSEFYEHELNISDSRINYLDKTIKENPKMSTKKIDIINQLKTLHTFIEKIILKSKLMIQKVKHLI